MIISKFFMRQEVLFLLKILIIVLSLSAQAFTKNIILDCDVTLVGIDGKEMDSNDSEVSDSSIDELEEFDIDEEIDDDPDDNEFLDNNDDDSVEDVIGSVKKNKEES